MSQDIRLATFNCENLFSRPKIFKESRDRSLELLHYVKLLQKELTRDVFDQVRIRELRDELKGYVRIRNIRGKYSKAAGADDWLGWVDLTPKLSDDLAIKNTARVISDIDADVICLIEVENRPALQEFHNGLLYDQYLEPSGKQGYDRILLIDGNDRRGIDISVMSRLPIMWIRSHMHERTMYNNREIPTFSRDCLEVQIELENESPLHLFINHFKSKGYSPQNDHLSNRRRKGQAERVAELVDEHDLQTENIVVAGDLNDGADSFSLVPLLTKGDLYNVNLELDPSERGTYRTGKEQLDYLIISSALRDNLQHVHVERRVSLFCFIRVFNQSEDVYI